MANQDCTTTPITAGMTYSCDSDDGFKEPYYDFDSELSVAPRRPRVGFQEADIRDTPRKPRPKSACSVQSTVGKRERLRSLTKGEPSKQTRCSSALGIRRGDCRRAHHSCLDLSPGSDEVPPADKSCIRNFKRSLKLLGLQLEGFDLGAGEKSPKPDIKNAKSKVNSLVTRRTVSLEDLHEAVVRVGFPLNVSEADKDEEKHRQVLAKAIYEEWYFKKQEEELKKKSEARRQQRVKQWEMQHRRCEQIRKSQESFSEWLYKKRKQKQEQLRRGPIRPLLPHSPISPERANSAYEYWKKEKEKLIKKKQEEIKEQQNWARAEDNNKRLDSEKAYQEWKKSADKEWFANIREISRKIKELEKEEEKKQLDKKKEAEMAYRGWLETKEEELRKKIKDTRRAQVEAQKRMAMRRNDRLVESQEAFLSWLDMVEERFCKELVKKRLQNQEPAN